MQARIVINVFEWKGTVHATADRVLPAPDRRHAQRRRVWDMAVEAPSPITEFEAVSLAIEALQALVKDG